eukprot:SAG31_NODE_1391_length_8535_cov_11.998696_2_plen_104_part_00
MDGFVAIDRSLDFNYCPIRSRSVPAVHERAARACTLLLEPADGESAEPGAAAQFLPNSAVQARWGARAPARARPPPLRGGRPGFVGHNIGAVFRTILGQGCMV